MIHYDRPIGIDLGTTNSEVALLDPSERELVIYEDRFKRRTVPSAVAWDAAKQTFLVGREARARRGRDPAPIESIKRKMGQAVHVACGPHELTPEEVSSKILAELRGHMKRHLEARGDTSTRLTRAVITVPAYFDAPQIEATRRAAELAALEPIGIIQEPTAAAMYHTFKRQLGDGVFLVYDLGGGTFDVSILRCVSGEYQVLAIDGDNYLGGDDFDRRFAEELRRRLAELGYALDLDVVADEADRGRFLKLVHLAQEIKESLSSRDVVPIARPDLLEDQRGERVELETEIGIAEYERAIADLVETTITCSLSAVEQAREKAGIGLADIDRVILVGGSTRVPLVVRRVREAICAKSKAAEPFQDEVDTCVALGAAIHAAQIGGLGVEDDDKGVRVVFNTPLVAAKSPLKLGLKVEQTPDAAREIAVLRAGNPVALAPLGGADQAVRLAVPLGPEPEQPHVLALRDHDGTTFAELPFIIYRGDVRPRASALSRPGVVAKDIALEVVRAGRRERRVLLPRGTALPMKVTQTFYTADQSGAVVLRLLQGRLPIKTLLLPVPAQLPTGTAVELTIRCDETMRLEARAQVAGQELWATVEPPKVPTFDATTDVEVLLEHAESACREVWGGRAEYYRREVGALSASIREAVRTDPDKLVVLCNSLQSLLEDVRPDPTAGGLAPPLSHFEWELDNLKRVVFSARGLLGGMDRAAWEERIRDIEERGQEAYQAADQLSWRRICNEVQALRETAQQEKFASMRHDDPAYLARRILSAKYRANEIDRRLAELAAPADEDVRALQLGERDRIARALRENLAANLEGLDPESGSTADVRRTLDRIEADLDRLELAVERIPSLGLVAEHGGPPSR
jgi:molecular chaperone DnaK